MNAAGIFRTIILLGAIQGFIVSALLCFSKKPGLSNRLLAALLLLISLACINLCATEGNWYGHSLFFELFSALVPLVIVMPMGPLIYFYIQSITDPSFTMTAPRRRQFYTAIIDVGPQLAALVYIIGILTGLMKNNGRGIGEFIDTYNVYADIPRWLSVTTYLWLSARYIRSLKSSAPWPRQLIRGFLAFQALWLVYLVPYVIPKYTDVILNTFDWYPLYVPLAIIIYWLGIKGFMIVQRPIAAEGGSLQALTMSGFAGSAPASAPSTVLSEETIRHTTLSLVNAMEEDKVYLDPGLNLSELAGHTGLPAKTISAVLNQHIHKSFNEFVNEYRIQAVKEKIGQPQLDHLTIVGIAFECGFHSQATFQRVFKEMTGESPSAFRKSARSSAQIRI